ncbi:hypothetical protein O6H91_07G056500 [Diphasiastrum complanatum]|uniref:Uncharacterized protein n=2 Tax=Diphasiastrum complanatum TaxID=34168 RepID=A0ACC2D5S9_DIPCM|nr:hypothetical protein O6H91_07G056500 [Diphasiastrum complanatum]KAJ7549503.1 hypothetical protein O6H91_07G056500 [Diphasiastrum complanatum]
MIHLHLHHPFLLYSHPKKHIMTVAAAASILEQISSPFSFPNPNFVTQIVRSRKISSSKASYARLFIETAKNGFKQSSSCQQLSCVFREVASVDNQQLLKPSQLRSISKLELLAEDTDAGELRGPETLDSRNVSAPEIDFLSKLSGILSNARRHKDRVAVEGIRSSVGVDLGDCRTGVAASLRGFAPRPVSVVQLRGDKLLSHLFRIAEKEGADEFVIGLPMSVESKETVQSNKVRSFAGRLARHAAERGWRVYLLDEYGTTQEALDYMLASGTSKRSRKDMIDAYAAMVLLHNYFENGGSQAQLVFPKDAKLQESLWHSYQAAIDKGNNEEDF